MLQTLLTAAALLLSVNSVVNAADSTSKEARNVSHSIGVASGEVDVDYGDPYLLERPYKDDQRCIELAKKTFSKSTLRSQVMSCTSKELSVPACFAFSNIRDYRFGVMPEFKQLTQILVQDKALSLRSSTNIRNAWFGKGYIVYSTSGDYVAHGAFSTYDAAKTEIEASVNLDEMTIELHFDYTSGWLDRWAQYKETNPALYKQFIRDEEDNKTYNLTCRAIADLSSDTKN